MRLSRSSLEVINDSANIIQQFINIVYVACCRFFYIRAISSPNIWIMNCNISCISTWRTHSYIHSSYIRTGMITRRFQTCWYHRYISLLHFTWCNILTSFKLTNIRQRTSFPPFRQAILHFHILMSREAEADEPFFIYVLCHFLQKTNTLGIVLYQRIVCGEDGGNAMLNIQALKYFNFNLSHRLSRYFWKSSSRTK